MFQYQAEVLRVIDGDTLELMIDLGFNVHVRELVRLAHINTPDELKYGLNGVEDPAKDFIMQRCPPGAVCIVNISRREKYGRWLADIYYLRGSIERSDITTKGTNLNQELISSGLAQPYEGGKK